MDYKEVRFTKRFNKRNMLLRALRAWEGNLPGFENAGNLWLNGNYRQIAYLALDYVLHRYRENREEDFTEEERQIYALYTLASEKYRGDLAGFCSHTGRQIRKNSERHLKRILDCQAQDRRAKTDSYWIVYLTNIIRGMQ